MNAYKEAIESTSTENSPWHIVPADKKWFTRVAVSEIIVKKLESLNLKYPTLTKEHTEELAQAKIMLESEK